MQTNSEPLNLAQYWAVIRRRRRSMFIAAFVVWAIACAFAWLFPPRYRAQATILIEKPKVPKQYVTPNIESDPQQQMQTLTQQILSRSRLQGIIDDLHLYTGTMFAGDAVESMRKDTQIDLTQTTSKPPELTGFTISYSGYDPRVVQKAASRLTSLFIEENLQSRAQQSENTTGFLDKQLQDARASVDEQAGRIKAFKAQFGDQTPGELQSTLQILNGMQVRLQQANEGLDRSEQQKMYLNSMLTAYREQPSLATTGVTNAAGIPVDVDAQLARLKAKLAELRSRYTDKHPAVLQVVDQIAKAEKLKAEVDKDRGDDYLPVSRGVAEIKSQLKRTDLDIQDRKKDVVSLQARIEGIENRLKGAPVREQQMGELNRDYEQSRKNYEALLGKKTDSAMATDMEKAQQGEQFSVLDPPSLPKSPYFPNRILVTLGGLAIGLAAAFGTAVLRETLDDRIHADTEISTMSKVPILVTIPPLTTPQEARGARWRTVAEIACASLAFVLMASSALVAYLYT
jgi:succinoglycan biosynthesis transport protein ExoP